MNIVAIDFETANSSRSSVCSIGIVEYQNGEIVDQFYSLVKPKDNYFDPYNSYIHGITEDDVKYSPEFDELWGIINKKLEEKLVIAHNASFDMSVLRHVLDEYDINYPTLSYNCSRNIAKKTWPGLSSYSLSMMAYQLGISFNHHHALEDAYAAAQVYLKAYEHLGVTSNEDLVEKLMIVQGSIFNGGYTPARINGSIGSGGNSKRIDVKSLVATTNEFDTNHPFYESSFAFTGTLKSMTRKEAMQKVVDCGGSCENNVTKQTNYLVMGDQDFSRFADGKKSNKLKKAEELILNGQDLEIISELDFIGIL